MSGWPQPDKPSAEIILVFDQASTLRPGKDLRDGLSAIVRQGDHLWVANDETTSLERLTLEDGQARSHRSFDLTKFLKLPGEGEIDIEGLDVEGDNLWLLGSHSSTRKRVRHEHTDAEARAALAVVEVSQRRQVLGRLSIKTLLHPDGTNDPHAAGVLGLGRGTGSLLNFLADDEHLEAFIRSEAAATVARPVPGKDNGIDCEGLAVIGAHVFIGLRGPVLRGWAVVIELNVGNGPGLEPQPIGPGGRRYRKHFLHLHGLGVRDLCRHGDDLLVLAGPTMELDGRTAVFRWQDVLRSHGEAVLHNSNLKPELEVPFGKDEDRAEGITLLDAKRVLVVYDTPSRSRKDEDHGIRADIFHLRQSARAT